MKKWALKYDSITLKKLIGVSLFGFSFLWFYYPAEYVLIANQDLSLFIRSSEYLLSFLDRPAGLIEYIGSFLNQFFRFRFAGALVLAGIITTGYFATCRLEARVSGKQGKYLSGVFTSVLLMGMHNYYPHQVSHSLGFILSMGLVAFLPSVKSNKNVFLVIAIPLFYFIGGGYVWFFCGLVFASSIVGINKTDYYTILLTTLYPAIIILVGTKMVYLNTFKELVLRPLPFGVEYGVSPWPYVFIAWMILFMFLVRVPIHIRIADTMWRRVSETVLVVIGLVLVLQFSFNRKNAEFFQIEKLAVREDWDGVLNYTAKHPSTNLFGSFYTNLALVRKGMICTELFQYPQPFGVKGLCFDWEAKSEILRRGGDFFWTIHLVNEAQHWAFESMIVDGFTQRNLKRLIQTELVRGNFGVAEKYIHYLGSALFHKKISNHYKQFLNNRKDIENDPELGPRLNIQWRDDFFSEGADLEENLRLMLTNDPSNRQAYDYLMALLLLEKEVDKIAASLPGYLEAGDGVIPTLLDESLLVYKISHREENLTGITVSQATIQGFEEYTRILGQYRDQKVAAQMLYPIFGDSFWFYLNFSSLPN